MAHAAEPAAPGAGPVEMTIAPPALELGAGAQARILVRTDGEPPRLETSAGTIEGLAETAPGLFTARLVPPLEAHPQLALVVARTGAGAAFVPVPLAGRGVAVVTTRPGASVSVRIRDRRFGPAVADPAGVALVPVSVPPGERYAYQGERAFDLRVPTIRTLHVVAGGAPLRADLEGSLTVLVAAATPHGLPWAGAPVVLSPSAGALEPPVEVAPGLFRATWRIPPGVPGTLAIDASAGPDTAAARATVERVAGPAARLELRLGAEEAIAGGAPLEVVAELTDAVGNGVDGDVRILASAGTVAPLERLAPGLFRSALAPPERIGGAAELAVRAEASGLSARRSARLVPGPPSSLLVRIEPAALVADGRAAAEIRVAVADRYGNPLDAAAPVLRSARGALSAPVATGGGTFRASYGARWSPREGEDAVVARVAGLEASAAVRLAAAPPQLAIGARAGVLGALGGFTAPFAAAGVEAWPLRLGGAWGAGIEQGWASSSSAGGLEVSGAPHDVRTDAALWPLSLSLLRRAALSPRLHALALAGAGAVAIRSAVSLDGAGPAAEWGTAPSLHAGAGLSFALPAPRTRLRAELRVTWQADPGMASFRGDLTTVSLTAGMSHDAL